MNTRPTPSALHTERNLLRTVRRPRPCLVPCGGGWRKVAKQPTSRNY